MFHTRKRRKIMFKILPEEKLYDTQSVPTPSCFSQSSTSQPQIRKRRKRTDGISIPGFRIPRSANDQKYIQKPHPIAHSQPPPKHTHSSSSAQEARKRMERLQAQIHSEQQSVLKEIADKSKWKPSSLFPPLHLNLFMRSNRFLNPSLVPSQSQSQNSKPTTFSQVLTDIERKLSTAIQPSDLKMRTRFRGGSAIDSPSLSMLEVSFSLFLYQQGFTLNDPTTGWRPYDRPGREFLESVDAGVLPISARTSMSSFHYYEGCLVAEVFDYRFLTAQSGDPKPKRVLLRPCSESVAADIEFLARRLHDSRKYELSLNDLKVEIEKRFLRVQNPLVCFEPSLRVLQTATLAYYNRQQQFVRQLDPKYIWHAALHKLRRPVLLSQKHEFMPSSAKSLCIPDPLDKLWAPHKDTKKRATLLKYAHFDAYSKSGKTQSLHNSFYNSSLLKSTVFNRSPALVNQSHVSSVAFVQKHARQQSSSSSSASSSGRYPRVTMQSKVHPKPPSERHPPEPSRYPQDVRTLRFYTQSQSSQMHDLFVFSRNGSGNGYSEGEQYEGILKLTTDADLGAGRMRFKVGDKAATDRFLEAYELQSEKEGRLKLQDNDVSASRARTEANLKNFISLDASETELQRRELEARHRKLSASLKKNVPSNYIPKNPLNVSSVPIQASIPPYVSK